MDREIERDWENDVNQKTEESRMIYNKMAFEYDTSREGRYTRFHIEELLNTINLNEGDVVLDIACGNGTLLGELSKKAKIRANGIDISENMIHAAIMRYPHINFKVKPCCPLEWSDESIDIITICCAFHHFDNPQRFVNECRRVLKKSGTVYVADPNFGAVIRFFANQFWFPFSKSGDVKVYGRKELEAIFYNGGFRIVQVYEKEKGLFLKARN